MSAWNCMSSPLAVATVAASDLAGAWKGTMDTQMGPVETTILVEAGPATLDAAQAGDFRRLALELVERQVAHIQKESMALLPMLDDLLDDETDRALSFACTSA